MRWVVAAFAKSPAVAAGAVAIMSTVPVEEAKSKLAGWLEAFGLSAADSILTPRADDLALGASVAVLSMLAFAAIRERLRGKPAPLTATEADTAHSGATSTITIHGGVTITHNRFADGKHLVGIEGKGEIVSPTPIYVQVLGAGVRLGALEAVAGAGAAEERWRANPGAGKNAAEVIAEALTLDDARAIWDAYRSTPHRTDMAWAFRAFVERLEAAGHGEETADLILALYEDGEDIDPTDEIEAAAKRWRSDGR